MGSRYRAAGNHRPPRFAPEETRVPGIASSVGEPGCSFPGIDVPFIQAPEDDVQLGPGQQRPGPEESVGVAPDITNRGYRLHFTNFVLLGFLEDRREATMGVGPELEARVRTGIIAALQPVREAISFRGYGSGFNQAILSCRTASADNPATGRSFFGAYPARERGAC